MKIFIAAVACVLGAVSHFYPIPFPQNKPLLAGCVVGYIICASLYYLIEKRYEVRPSTSHAQTGSLR